jgi:hypothetical protein
VSGEYLEGRLASWYWLQEVRAKAGELKAEESERAELRKLVDGVLGWMTPELARNFYDYIVGACWAELGHICRISGHKRGFLGSCRYEIERDQVFNVAEELNPQRVLEISAGAFLDPVFCRLSAEADVVLPSGVGKSGYGGVTWSKIAEAGLMYGKETDQVFIDHAVDLSHNGGSFVGKTTKFFGTNRDAYVFFLDFKKQYSLLESGMAVTAYEGMDEVFKYARALGMVVHAREQRKWERVVVKYGMKEPVLVSGKGHTAQGAEVLAAYEKVWNAIRAVERKGKKIRLGSIAGWEILRGGTAKEDYIPGCICDECKAAVVAAGEKGAWE